MINFNDYINILPCFKLDTRSDIIRISILSRLFAIIVQGIGNSIIIDHNANVFTYKSDPNMNTNLFDDAVQSVFQGFTRWDGQYFMHIAKYGYTYENALAFFPLYPIVIRMLSGGVALILPLLNDDSTILIAFVVFNLIVFVSTTLVLYDLSSELLGTNIAHKAAILFCFNPASVFFSAFYTECLFCYFTFKAVWHLQQSKNNGNRRVNFTLDYKRIIKGVFYISLGICTRSNGMINVGFLLYYYVKHVYRSLYANKYKMYPLVKHTLLLGYFTGLCFIPFMLIQSYNYFMFCSDFKLDLPEVVLEQAKANNFVLPGSYSKFRPEWCDYDLPFAYSYVQREYWHVGFLKYYELKQIPNFLLAAPIIGLVLLNCIAFFKEHPLVCLNLGIFNVFKDNVKNKNVRFSKELFVFVVHLFALTWFCVFFIHIQVTTRMLCSSSPLIYWFCAYYFETFVGKSKIFLLDRHMNGAQNFVRFFFLGYFLIGIVMFCNFLPWT